MKKFNIRPEWQLIIILATLKLLIHFFTNTNYELHRDAFLYLSQIEHLDWGYMSVPPLLAFLGKIILSVFGDSTFAVRLLPALVGTASVIIISMIVLEIGGRRWAILLASVAFILSPAFLRSNTLFQPVSLNQFFWLLSSYFVLRLINSQSPRYWIHLGILWGVAFLNKYSIVFFALALVIGLLMTPNRRLLFSRNLLFGAALGFIIILPNLFWQQAHNWPVITHMAELQRTQLVNVNIGDFFALQFLMNAHAVILWMAGLLFLLTSQSFTRKYQSLGLAYLVLLLLMIILRGKAYYTLGAYPMLFAAGGVAIAHYFRERYRYFKPGVLGLMLLFSLPVIPYGLPLLPMDEMVNYTAISKDYGMEGALRWEDGQLHPLPQDYADMIGWEGFSEIVIDAYNGLDENEKANCQIYAENYGLAGALLYYGRDVGLPEPVSFSDNFLLWAPENFHAEVFIYINRHLGQDISSNFDDIELAGTLTNPYAREKGVKVYICRQPKGSFAGYYQEKIKNIRGRYY